MLKQKELIEALSTNRLYDYVAQHYFEATTYELKELLLAVLGVCYDKCCGDEDEQALMDLITEECKYRGVIDNDSEDC